MKHLKRQKTPKNWPIKRKGSVFIAKPNFSLNKGVSLLFFIRDMLKAVKTRKELKQAIHEKKILVNGNLAKEEKNTLMLFDKISFVPQNKNYELDLGEKGKFVQKEISEKETKNKISKIINKKTLNKKKTQINLSDGRNFISDLKCKTNDSVLINLKEKKIEKCLALKEKAKAMVFTGKHAGKRGQIEKIKPERKMVSLKTDKEKINVLIKQIMVIE
jgi:small subunit ribosomal protein S4e